MECLADCPNVVTPTDPAVNTPGFHSDGKTCIADIKPTDAKQNNACVPVTSGSTVNLTKQMCEVSCATALLGSHKFNGVCVVDTAKPNPACTTATDGSSASTAPDADADSCLPDCKDDTDATKTVNTPGYHDVDGTCTEDGASWMGRSMGGLVWLALVMYM